MFCEKDVLKSFVEFAGKHLCQSLFFNKFSNLQPATLSKKETLAQFFFFSNICEFCKNAYFVKHLTNEQQLLKLA